MQKILIVEDEKAISGVLHSILSDELPDYHFEIAEDGLEGYKYIEKEDFALVISDIKMPKLSGTELLKQTLQVKPDTTFLMISGHADIVLAQAPYQSYVRTVWQVSEPRGPPAVS